MRIPRSRGAVSGLLLMVLGAWGALIPFIGPYFNVSMGTDQTWDWTTGRLWLSVIPGAVAFVGGFLLFSSAHRAKAGFGAWMATAAGIWFVIGTTISMLWNHGVSQAGNALGSTNERVLTVLVSYDGLGVVITGLGAFALGRLAVRSVRDVELAREDQLARDRADGTDRFERTPATSPSGREVPARDREVERTTPGATDDRTAVVPPREERTAVGEPVQQRTTPVAPPAPAEPHRSGGLMGRLRRN
jgi:hypothetical protein